MFAPCRITWQLGLILAATVLVLAGCGPQAFEGTKKAPHEFDPGPGAGGGAGPPGAAAGDDGGTTGCTDGGATTSGAPPGAPANLTAQGMNATVALTWEVPTEGGPPAEYHIHSADAEGVDTSGEPGATTTGIPYATVSGTTTAYQDTAPSPTARRITTPSWPATSWG